MGDNNSAVQVDPPTHLVAGSVDESVLARQNFIERERASRPVLSLLPFGKKKVTPLKRRHNPQPQPSTEHASASSPATDRTNADVSLDDKHLDAHNDATLYRWAYVYENQRGTTLFRTFRFSSNALFSFDPPPFSMARPTTSKGWDKQPLLTLNEYPLPDGSWRWLSTEWMIDMRDGNVSYDGFEYNWAFGGKKWRSRAGRLNTGALVRRRRWARLMFRPGGDVDAFESSMTDMKPSPDMPTESIIGCDFVWKGNSGDWNRCRAAIRSQEGDGRKLELWEDWIGHEIERNKRTEDPGPSSIDGARVEDPQEDRNLQPSARAILAVLRQYGLDILYTFIYPSTRTRFLQLLTTAGMIPELPEKDVANSLQFWDRIREFSRN